MPLSVECPECGTRYNVPDKLAGKKARCKKCGATIPIPAPALTTDTPIGFAAEDDPMAALADLARATGEAETPAPDVAPAPAAPRRRGGTATIPADWTPESVIVEKESSPAGLSAGGSGRWGRRTSPIDPNFLARLIVFVYVAATIGLGAYLHSLVSGSAETRGVVALWTLVGANVLLFFVVAAPMTMLGALIGAKIFGQYLVDGAYTRAAGLAGSVGAIVSVAALLMMARVLPADRTVPLLIMALVLPVTFVLVMLLFEMTLPQTIVAWILCGVLGMIGFSISGRVSTAIATAVRGEKGEANRTQVASGGPGGWLFGDLTSRGGGRTEQTQSTRSQEQPQQHEQQQSQPQPPRTRNDPRRAESAEHLRRIHAALSANRARAKGAWPAELATLRQDGALDEQALKSPFGPAFAAADYVYTPFVDQVPPTPDVVLAYDNAELSSGEGTNLLYASGQVKWLEKSEAEAAIQRSEQARAAATQVRQQMLASGSPPPQQGESSSVFPGTAAQGSPTTPVPNPNAARVAPRGDVAEKIKASSQGFVRDVTDVAVRRGTEQIVRPATTSAFVGVLVRDPQGDTVEIFDGKSSDPVQTAQFPSEQQFRNNPGAYALSPDGKLLAHLVTFPKLRVSVYSFEKKAEAAAIDLPIPEQGADPTIVGFLGNDRLLVRWVWRFQYGLEVWDVKTAKRTKQVPLGRVDPQPSPGSEAISPDGKTYAVLNQVPPAAANPRAPAAAREPGMAVLLYDVVAGGTQPRRFLVPVLNNVPGVQALGLSFSPDKTKLALLLVDPQGRGVVAEWPTNTGKPLPEKVLAEKIDAMRMGFNNKPRLLDWLAEGRALLAGGRLVINADTGDTLAILDAGKIHAQAVTGDATLHLAHGDYASLEGLAVVNLNEARLPEKPGQPNRATAAPVR